MWWSEPRRLALAATLALAGCGFAPLYAPGGPAAAVSGRVAVALVDGDAGFALRERLVDRLGEPDGATHRLDVALDLDQVGVALTGSDVTTRFDVAGLAAYRLTPIGSDAPVLTGETGAVTGYNAPSSSATSPFAVLSARRDAEERLALLLADRIVQRLAVDAADWLE